MNKHRRAALGTSVILFTVAACAPSVVGGGGGASTGTGTGGDSMSTAAIAETVASTTGPGVTTTGPTTVTGTAVTSTAATGTTATTTTATGTTVTATTATATTATTTSSGTGGAGGSSPATPADTVAMFLDQVPLPTQIGSGSSPQDPESLVLFWSNLPETCSTGQLSPVTGELVWQSALVIPPDQLQLGPVDMSQVSLYSWAFYADGNGGGGGGGPGLTGSMEIVAIDASFITVNLITPITVAGSEIINGVAQNQPVTLEGYYAFARCPGQ